MLLLRLLLLTTLLLPVSCDTISSPTYTLATITTGLADICQKEYAIPIVSTLKGRTLWIYLPLEEELFIDTDTPQESLKAFELQTLEGSLAENTIKFDYSIAEIPEIKESQNKKINPLIAEKMRKVFNAIRRVILSLQHNTEEPIFFATVTSDIKNGIEIIEITYIDDLKKALYGLISITEYQHRSLQDIRLSFEAIGDKDGKHLRYTDLAFKDFLIEQMKQRIHSKFSRPEVKKGADIDKEVMKSIQHVLEIYKFSDFSMLELKNIATENKISLSRAAILEKSKE